MKIDAEGELKRRAAKISRDDVKGLLGKKSVAARLSQRADFLSGYWADIKTSFALIHDWYTGAYDKIPMRMIASLAAALLYFVSPLDLVPDWIPFAGLLDDAAVLGAVFNLSAVDLNAYRRWKSRPQVEVVDV